MGRRTPASEGEEGGGEGERGAEGGDRDREDAADHGEPGEDGVHERPGRTDVDGLDLDLSSQALEPLLQICGGPALGIAAGSTPADVDEGIDVGAEVHVGGQYPRVAAAVTLVGK